MKKATVNEVHEAKMRAQACIRWGRRGRMIRRLDKGMILFKDDKGVYRKIKELGQWKKRLIDKLAFFTWLADMAQKAKYQKNADWSKGAQK